MVHVVTSARKDVRDALKTAMPGINWSRKRSKTDTSTLPRGAVVTPTVATEKFSAEDVGRTVTVQVWIKREGGDDLEDVLDADSALVETTVLGVLDSLSHDYDLDLTETNIDAAANVPVGVLQMNFTVLLVTAFGDPNI